MNYSKSEYPKVVATSPSFSRHEVLRDEMHKFFPGCRLNDTNRRFANNELISFIDDADAVIIGLEKIDAPILSSCSSLRIIAKYGVGLDNIDLYACDKAGVAIGWTAGVNRLPVAELTIGFMLSLCRNIAVTSSLLKNGTWDKNGGTQLSGKTVGVIGAGHIGREVIRILEPFQCSILVNDIVEIDTYCQEHGLKKATKEEIFSCADIVSIHTPLDKTTRNIFNRQTLEMMKQGAFLINTARGGIVNQDDLAWALTNGVIAGAALDVYESEPPDDSKFLSLPNLICTPHIGGNSEEAVYAMGMSAINHLKEFFGR